MKSNLILRLTVALLAICTAPLSGAHQTQMSNQPWEVCETRSLGDQCEYTNDHGDIYRGTCRAMSNALVCVRNQPIEKQVIYAPHDKDGKEGKQPPSPLRSS